MRAAHYVRMSTEHQQFSIENQMVVINDYAKSHDLEIVRTYSDEARSGIDLTRPPGLKQLLADIENLRADFRAVLVYDVSRWGRFQDADESAFHEFFCRNLAHRRHNILRTRANSVCSLISENGYATYELRLGCRRRWRHWAE